MVEQTECWIREVVKSSSFTSPEVVAEFLNIEEGLGDTGDSNINNIQVLNKEDEPLRAFLNTKRLPRIFGQVIIITIQSNRNLLFR